MKDIETKNSRNPVRWLGRLLAIAVASLVSAAESANDAPPKTDEALVLSPFIVNSSQDTGYYATSTLAGTRINSPLKDLGASISVYTKNLLDDIGATNSSDLLVFATGMEAAGPGGNYSGASNDINATQPINEGQRLNPQGTSRTRGLASPSFTRGYFLTGIAFDSYNTDTVTVSRGPNAALFGVGSAAGVVDTSLVRPNLQRNSNTVVIRYGNNDSLRGSVDFNRVLIAKKLALRIAALRDREEFNQRPAFEEKKRIYGALTFEPFKSTSLRANFESGNTRANRPITLLPSKGITSAWYDAGRPSFDWTYYDDPARNPDAATQNAGNYEGNLIATNQIGTAVAIVYSNPSANTPAYAFNTTIGSTSGSAANVIKSQIYNPLVNRDIAADTIRFLSTNNIFNLPASYWTGVNVLPGQLPGMVPAGIKYQGFTDFSAFDFKNRMIDECGSQMDSFHAFNVTFEQRAWKDRVGIELTYDAQRVDRRSKDDGFSSPNANNIRIDTNVTLATGAPNPNLGRPFALLGFGNRQEQIDKREVKRATGYLKYDFKDLGISWGKWIGRHTLTGLYQDYARGYISFLPGPGVVGAAAEAISTYVNVFSRRPVEMVYIGPSIIGNNNPLQLQPIQVSVSQVGSIAVPVTYFVRAADAVDPGHFEGSSASLVEYNVGGSTSREVIRSQAAVLQSYWFQDYLVTTFGWRRDKDYYISKTLNYVANPADPNDPGQARFGFNDFTFPITPPLNVAAEIKSYSAVLHWPQKLIKLPGGTDFSVFYDKSENFAATGGRINGFGEAQPAPQGQTEEFGFGFSALNQKLTLRVNWFKTAVQGQSNSPSVYLTTISGVLDTAGAWAMEGNYNPQLVARRNADVELLFSALPANFRELYHWQVTGTAPQLAYSRIQLIGSTDTTDYTAKGTEIELICSPTRNWRILANVAKQETTQTNAMPFLKQFVARMKPVWDQLKDRPKGNYPLGWQPGDPLPGAVQTWGQWLDTNMYVPFATAIATEGSASAEQRKWRANLVTNYTFGRGSIFGEKLKGWGIGGAVRWQDKLGIGYPTSRNPDSSVNIDLAHPYYAPPETNLDAWVSYERKLWNDRINWKVQLNVRNLYGDGDLIAVGAQPWGEIATVRLAPERRWYVTNSFSF